MRDPTLPPSSFRHGLLAEDRDKTLRRTSRIDIDFEQALLSTDTITLREGRDVNSLGNEHDPATAPTMEDQRTDTNVASPTPAASIVSPLSAASSRRLRKSQPTLSNAPHTLAAKSTNTDTTPPITISDTINSLPGSSGFNCSIQNPSPRQEPPADGPPPASIPIPRPPKQQKPGEDPDDVDLKRRSLFRSPGTASSPDLATLVRKQRERNAALPSLPTTTSVADAWGTVNARQRTVSRETGKVGFHIPARAYLHIYLFTSLSLPSRCARKPQTSSPKSLVATAPCERKEYAPLPLIFLFFWNLDMCSWNPPPPVQVSHTTTTRITRLTQNIRHLPHHPSLRFRRHTGPLTKLPRPHSSRKK